ncbi:MULTISPECIES: hypothetical protein [unclassified Arthrobacter]|uniref:hypothetical protein n=1 Tax=unclassified Arthrobacter TaxID=235627 RepID=UPI001C84B7EA|nr:hypothetical protein [Arthrobacter sp. MAHUQ-56]MBX7443031.1 hypothetical protein [Arthrobacter sp. MAHUQ-56]
MTLPPGRAARLLLGCSALVLSAIVLSACAPANNGLQRDVATQLQARVLEVTQASSQNDAASALKALDGLESDLSAAQAKGRVSEDRRRSITTVATAVRADLNEALAAQQAKAAEDARIAAEQAAAQSPSPAPEAKVSQAAPAPAPGAASGNGTDAGKNNGDKGKGKN